MFQQLLKIVFVTVTWLAVKKVVYKRSGRCEKAIQD